MKTFGYFTSLPLGNPDSLMELDVPEPTPSGQDLLVEVEAVSVNPIDVKVRNRRAAADGVPVVLGWDAVGWVRDTGEAATGF
ncbi:alcohol dehydrogenase catalytic domain-containing protein, partial [Myxococcota bacterium]|nr:alcohol dehydrogenase catalytic domain-containing protein [Myxococcota bacterium]